MAFLTPSSAQGKGGALLAASLAKNKLLEQFPFGSGEKAPAVSAYRGEQQCSPECRSSVLKAGECVDDHWYRKGSRHTPYSNCRVVVQGGFQGDSQPHISAVN